MSEGLQLHLDVIDGGESVGLVDSTLGLTHHTLAESTAEARSVRNAHRVGVVLEGVLYWAGFKEVNNAKNVSRRSITGFLCVAEEVQMPSFLTAVDLERHRARYLKLPLQDNASTALREHFEQAFRFIDGCRAVGMPVVVYCKKGQSRSASIAAAYIMREYDVNFNVALDWLRRSKKADPNFAFCQQLDSYGDSPALALPPRDALKQSANMARSLGALSTATGAPKSPPSYFIHASLSGSDRSADGSFHVQHHHRRASKVMLPAPVVDPATTTTTAGAAGRGHRVVDASSMLRDFNPLSLEDTGAAQHHRTMLDASLLTNPECTAEGEDAGAGSRLSAESAGVVTDTHVDLVSDDDNETGDDVEEESIDADAVRRRLAESGVMGDQGTLRGGLEFNDGAEAVPPFAP